MVLTFTSLSDEIAVGGIVAMFLLWLIVSRTGFGFLLCSLGTLVIAITMAYVDGNSHVPGMVIAGGFILALVVTLFVLMRTRRRTYRVYKPSAKYRRPR
jgi:membrane-bound ClpP family serine protease